MPGRRSFKTDESFLEKISIGAIGTRKVFDHLKSSGHVPIELERGSMSFKIWKGIKIKRVRVPDILCVKCGKRVESRAKTKLVVSMSHSAAIPERGWDYGLDDSDYIAFVRCSKVGDGPIDWQASDLVQYVTVKAMREAFRAGKIITERSKGAEEGFEMRITWPCAIAALEGLVVEVNGDVIKIKRSVDKRIVSLKLLRKKIDIRPTVKVGESIKECQIVASVAPIFLQVKCDSKRSAKDYVKLLSSSSHSDRYTAVKALARTGNKDVLEVLKRRMQDAREHVYIRMESAAGILRFGSKDSLPFFEAALQDTYLANRLECVITLGEIQHPEATKLLIGVLSDGRQDAEIRAGAAWALGELRSREGIQTLINAFEDEHDEIKAESARAMLHMMQAHRADVIKHFPGGTEEVRAGISWALSKSGQVSVKELLPIMVDEQARRWIAWIIGTQKEGEFISQIEELKKKDHEIYFAVTVLWKILSSWVSELKEY